MIKFFLAFLSLLAFQFGTSHGTKSNKIFSDRSELEDVQITKAAIQEATVAIQANRIKIANCADLIQRAFLKCILSREEYRFQVGKESFDKEMVGLDPTKYNIKCIHPKKLMIEFENESVPFKFWIG
jgi:hypothetical protein